MSEENLEVLRACFDAFQRGDEPAMLELVDPSCVFTPLPETPDVQSYHGHEGLLHAFDEVGPGAWDDFSIEVRDMRDFDDHVLASCRSASVLQFLGAPLRAPCRFPTVWK